MSIQSLGWIYAAGSLLSLAFHVAVLIYVAVQPSDRSSAKTYALIGFGISLLSLIAGSTTPIILGMVVDGESMALIHGILGIALRLVGMVGTGFLVAAIFTGRSSAESPFVGKLTPGSEQNPYASP